MPADMNDHEWWSEEPGQYSADPWAEGYRAWQQQQEAADFARRVRAKDALRKLASGNPQPIGELTTQAISRIMASVFPEIEVCTGCDGHGSRTRRVGGLPPRTDVCGMCSGKGHYRIREEAA